MRRALFLFGLLFLGCQTPAPVPSGFLRDYSSLRAKPGTGIYFATSPERPGAVVHFSDPGGSAVTSPAHVVVVRSVEWRAGELPEPEVREELRGILAACLRKQLFHDLSPETFVVETDRDAESYQQRLGATVMRIDAAITSVEKGKGWQRYLIGCGWGDAKMVVEARAALSSDIPGQESQIHVFARAHGNPYGGLNFKVFSGRYCLKQCCERVARSMASHLAQRIRPPKPGWWERSGPGVPPSVPAP